jgi:hypothetical protein
MRPNNPCSSSAIPAVKQHSLGFAIDDYVADTNVALRRRDLDAGVAEFFLNGKVEIAPVTPRPERFLTAAFYKIGLTKNWAKPRAAVAIQPVTFYFFYGRSVFFLFIYFSCLFIDIY